MTGDQQHNRIPEEVSERMPPFSAPYITAIAKTVAEDEGDFVGSGCFMVLAGQTFLVTAQHVATDAETGSFEGAAFSNGDGKLYQRVIPPFHIDKPLDIAISPVALDRSAASTRQACPSRYIAQSSGALDDLLFVYGFPGVNSRFLKVIPGIASITLPYLANRAQTIPTWEHFNPQTHFAMTFDHAHAKYLDGASATLPFPVGGMSGSPVWNTRREEVGDNWQPADARIVGVIHRWDQDARCIIGTRIEHVHGFVASFLAAQGNQDEGPRT